MSAMIVELLFWTVVFVVLFFGFKKLQARKSGRDKNKTPTVPAKTETEGRQGDKDHD